MNAPIIEVRSLGKRYRLGSIGAGSLRAEAEILFQKMRSLAGQPTHKGRARVEDFWALKDVSFEVKEGEVLGVIGRNGAGKSTLLKILSRITEPTEGEARLSGRLGALLEVGTGFHPELTGRENIYLNGAILGMKKREIDGRFKEIVEFAEIGELIHTPVKRYSSGQRVRLAFAVAAHLQAEILVIDEVLAVGDIRFQERCVGKMQEVSQSGRTVLFVSHNMAAVEGLCSRVVVLDGGKVHYMGETEEGISRYVQLMGIGEKGQYQRSPHTGAPGKAWIESARLLDAEEQPAQGMFSGEVFRIEITCRAGERITQPWMGVGIDSQHGQRVATLHTTFDPELSAPAEVEGTFVFRCEAPDLALHPGAYALRLRLEGSGGTLDLVDRALVLDVYPSDYYRNGGRIGPGLVLCRQNWRCEQR